MKIVVDDSDFKLVFEADLPPFDGSDEAYQRRTDILMEELNKRVATNPEFKAKLLPPDVDFIRDYYVDKVTPLTIPSGGELWGLGT